MFNQAIYDEILDEFSDYLLEFMKTHIIAVNRLPYSEEHETAWRLMLGYNNSQYNDEIHSKLISITKQKTSDNTLDIMTYVGKIVEEGSFTIDLTGKEFTYATIDVNIPVVCYFDLEEKFDECDWREVEVDDNVCEAITTKFTNFILEFYNMMEPFLGINIDEGANAYGLYLTAYVNTLFNELISITNDCIENKELGVSVARKVYQDSFHRRWIYTGLMVPHDKYMDDVREHGTPILLQYTIKHEYLRKALGTQDA